MGAGRVIVIDHLEYRLEKARTFAHAETYNFTEYDDIVVHMKKITDHLGADVAIDAVGAEADGNFLQHVTSAKLKLQGGSPVALNWAIDSVRKGGTVSVVGAYGPMFSAVKFGDALNKGLTLRMNQCPVKRQWPRLFEHVRNGYLKPSDIVTHRIPLEHIAEGYHIFSAKLDGCIKPLIVPSARLRRGGRHGLHRRTSRRCRVQRAAARPHPRLGRRPRPGDRPSVPKLQFDPDLTGAHWDFPERQPEKWPRERSIEHAFLTPVFGTSCPPKGLSGVMRKARLPRYSEARRRTGCCCSPPTGSTPGESTCARSPRCARTTRSPRPACERAVPRRYRVTGGTQAHGSGASASRCRHRRGPVGRRRSSRVQGRAQGGGCRGEAPTREPLAPPCAAR
jgi:hypothetical protein